MKPSDKEWEVADGYAADASQAANVIRRLIKSPIA